MFVAYVALTILAALFSGSAAVVYLIGHPFPKAQLRMKGLPQWWGPVLGGLLAAGTAGLLAGFVWPVLGLFAAGGLVLYFVGALVAHLRVGSRDLANWSLFFAVDVATFTVAVIYHV
ncbi:DoxX family protein [Dactylosporangium siamense]|uniref:DoxX family protein n=1 Tax=Dactylosporangium siamense TaxID=685454 RepID=A0A919Q033_9ACTN|nr:DoxX family protein [Dactylosporangium siamense]GIG52431.1 hypothetical protein Dsi01nite_104720 [Dactylosporangium siamense]